MQNMPPTQIEKRCSLSWEIPRHIIKILHEDVHWYHYVFELLVERDYKHKSISYNVADKIFNNYLFHLDPPTRTKLGHLIKELKRCDLNN
jgi:hypothetical protein